MNKEQRLKKQELSNIVFTQDIIKTNPETVKRIILKLYEHHKLSRQEYCVFLMRHGLMGNMSKTQSFSQIANSYGTTEEEILITYNSALKLVSKNLIETAFNLELAR